VILTPSLYLFDRSKRHKKHEIGLIMKHWILLIVGLFSGVMLFAQAGERTEQMEINGETVTALITETDTILIADLEDVSVSSPRKFENRAEYRRYLKYRRYANKVYPYAVEAIMIFREMELATAKMKKRKRRRYIKKLQKRYKKEFKDPLKKLSKTQGKILVKMIEKELNRPFYSLLRDLRGTMTAAYWNTLSKAYGYRLKEGYIEGKDPILDAVLYDFKVDYTPTLDGEIYYPEEDVVKDLIDKK